MFQTGQNMLLLFMLNNDYNNSDENKLDQAIENVSKFDEELKADDQKLYDEMVANCWNN